MDTTAKENLQNLYDRLISRYGAMAKKREAGECTYLEIEEAKNEMEAVRVNLEGMER